MEMARLFQTELEHYEKVEGENLSLDGKANKLGQMIRMNLPMAMQGLVVVPIFAGFDERAGVGRLFKYDVTGGRYEETDYFAQGSGGKDARDSLKKRFKRDMSRDEALQVAIEALIDAADEDLGTGGPDLLRGILPSVKTITRSGFAEAPEGLTLGELIDRVNERLDEPWEPSLAQELVYSLHGHAERQAVHAGRNSAGHIVYRPRIGP